MNRPADWEQREQGRDLLHSYIVQAPAGSGKTELLTQRMLGLLAHVENPEEVVAITFTRKAAAEMRNRLIGHLQAAAGQVPGVDEALEPHQQVSRELALAVLANDTSQGWSLLEQPGRLRVLTIDSLCSELARQLPVLSGLGGGQQIATDATALYRQAATRTMAAIEDGSDELQADVIRVLDRYDNQYDRLVELLTGMLASREQWIGHLLAARQGDGFDRQGLEAALWVLVESQLQTARRQIPDSLLEALPGFFNYALANEPADKAELAALLEACGGADCAFLDLPVHAEALPHWQTMINRLLTSDGNKWRAAPGAAAGFPALGKTTGEERAQRRAWKGDFKALLDEHRENDRLRDTFNTIRTLPSPSYDDEAWESLESLMRILLRAAENWGLVMAESGEVDYGEMATRAIQSLGFEGAPSDLALRMDYRIQHLLVDEFQDTSASQVQLLDKLTAGWTDGDGRTLFLVGDPMQSIYRFRKAEVSLFIKAWQGRLFEHIQLKPLQLSVNFRSTRPIVEWVNTIFPRVMAHQDDPLMGAVRYSPADTKPGASSHGTVDIQILPDRDDDEEARQIVDLIGNCEAGESIAVLVRVRSHASNIMAELDRRKLNQPRYRYQAIDFIPLAETSLIQDLVSLTLALIQPADRLAWLATLRSPFIGLELGDMDELVAGQATAVLLDAIGAAAGLDRLSSDGQTRLQRTAPVLLEAVNRRGRQSVRSLVESAWVKLGGPACVGNASELDDAATYFDLLDTLEGENLPIDRDTLALRMKDLHAEPDASADGKLQILTIYTAKGLQFDTVILPGLNLGTRNDDNKLLHWFELAGEDRIVMSPMRNTEERERQKKSGDLIKFISNIEKQRKNFETGRLLYVAATRAIHSLHLFAAIKPTVKGVIKAKADSLLGRLWSAIEDEQTGLIQQAADKLSQPEDGGTDADTKAPFPQQYRRLVAEWQLPVPPPPVQSTKTRHSEAQSYIEFSWAGEDARLTGDLVHRLLQLIGEQGPEHWAAGSNIPKRTSWCRQQLAAEGVRQQRADTIIARTSTAIENCLASERGAWILKNHDEARCEYAITAVLDGEPRKLVLDRTFVADGARWIIDYKTSRHSGGDLDGFLESEANRYREQLQAYKNAMAITETRPIRTALYFPMFDRFLEVS